MASCEDGILGALKGSIGPVTGYMRNGKNVLRKRTSVVKDKATPRRAAQREKLCICNQFTKAFVGTGFFTKTFPAYGSRGTGFNRATGALMSLAVTGAYPDMQLNYDKVLISKGRLPGAQNEKMVKKANNILQFSFSDNSEDGIASPDDTVILVAYSPILKQAMFTLNGGYRKDKKASLNVAAFKGYAIETWIGFLSKDEAHAGDSVWAGRMVV
jgi:hypothetical protein